MSYSIEYNKFIYKWEDTEGETYYLLALRIGDNNLYDYDGQRVKSWCIDFIGNYNELWDRIGQLASATVGGNLQKSLGGFQTRYYEIPEYVKQYRSKIRNARPIERFLSDYYVSVVEEHRNHDKEDSLEVAEKLAQKLRDDKYKLFNKFEIDRAYLFYGNVNVSMEINDTEDLKELAVLSKYRNRKDSANKNRVYFNITKRGRY